MSAHRAKCQRSKSCCRTAPYPHPAPEETDGINSLTCHKWSSDTDVAADTKCRDGASDSMAVAQEMAFDWLTL